MKMACPDSSSDRSKVIVWLIALLFHSKVFSMRPIQPLPAELQRTLKSESLPITSGLLSPSPDARWSPINILPDYSALRGQNEQVVEFVKRFLVPHTLSRLRDLISTKRTNSIPPFNSTACDDYFPVPSDFHSRETAADLILFVRLVESSTTITAFSLICGLTQEDQRPAVGLVTLNIDSFSFAKSQIESVVRTLIHEVFHVLAFSPILFNRFPIGASRTYLKTKSTTGGSQTKLILPGLLSFARDYFACNTLDGILLEDEGSSGSADSHFEKKLLGNEIMTGQLSAHQVLSNFTLHFINDIGWYKVNFSQAEKLTWGEKKGCSFINENCQNNFEEFCSDSLDEGCTPDFLAKSSCFGSMLTNKCKIREHTKGKICTDEFGFISTASYESSGPFARCFLTRENGQKGSGCYESRCLDEKTIQIIIEKSVFNCTIPFSTFSYKKVTIICPDPSLFCSKTFINCPQNCSGRGVCLSDGICKCNALFKGEACQEEISCQGEIFCSLLQNSLSSRSIAESFVKFAALPFNCLFVILILIY